MTHTARPLSRSAARTHSTVVRTSPARRTLTTAVLGTAAGLALLVAPATASAAPSTASAGSPGDAEKSIVFVGIEWTGYVEYETSDGGWAWSEPVEVLGRCTGWFASEQGHVVTAGHCLDPEGVEAAIRQEFLARNDALELADIAQGWRVEGEAAGAPPDRTDVWIVQPSAVEGAVVEDPLTVQVLEHQSLEDGDLALLKANGMQEPAPPLPIAVEPPSIGDPVTSIGYPGSVLDLSDPSRLRASFKTGTVSSTQISPAGVANTEINAQVSGGMSGGPTIDASGHVLGVNSFGHVDETQSFNFITDGAALRSFLEHQGVETQTGTAGVENVPAGEGRPFEPTASSRSGGAGLPGWAYGAGVLALALGAGGAFVVTRGAGGRTAPAAASAGSAPSASASAPVPPAGPAAPAAAAFPAAPAAADSRPERTRLIGRTLPQPPVATLCRHAHNTPGASFCGDCGSPLVR